MNLYLVTDPDYDSDGFRYIVVAAEDEGTARNTDPRIPHRPDHLKSDWKWPSWTWTNNPAALDVQLIGQALPGDSGIVAEG